MSKLYNADDERFKLYAAQATWRQYIYYWFARLIKGYIVPSKFVLQGAQVYVENESALRVKLCKVGGFFRKHVIMARNYIPLEQVIIYKAHTFVQVWEKFEFQSAWNCDT